MSKAEQVLNKLAEDAKADAASKERFYYGSASVVIDGQNITACAVPRHEAGRKPTFQVVFDLNGKRTSRAALLKLLG